jgi:hypothetical protein
MLEIIVFILLFLTAASWLMGKLAKRPDAGCRGMTFGCGLFLAVFMTVMFIKAVTDPNMELMAALVIVPWIALGVILIAEAVKNQ